ncbi:MAG: Rieske (2Fe-2S) protein [Bacteroidetes bacterium]|nr:Rieske (2Fe-2S) protein [Bacteroidota bacterium]
MALSKLVLPKDYLIPQYSIGWFVIAQSSEVPAGKILSKKFSGKDIVIFRTESGKISVVDAYCPHMGAHFGHGGTVEGEDIRCPFHGFKFNKEGSCTATGYGTKPSPRAKLHSWPVFEKLGFIFCFYHPEKKQPHYDINDYDMEGWTDFKVKTWELESNPIEISENSVDVGHFVHIHGFMDPYSKSDLRLEGPFLFAEYGFNRKDFINPKNKIKVEIEIYQQGLGFALVEATTMQYDIRTRHLVMPVSVNGKVVELRIASSVKKIEDPGKILKVLKVAPKGFLTEMIAKTIFKKYCGEVYSDFKIWKNKIYIHPPALSKGDGPIIQYRQWAAQFDPSLQASPAEVLKSMPDQAKN